MLATLSSWTTIGGDDRQGRLYAETALRLAREAANPSAIGGALFALGYATEYSDPEVAALAFDECVAIARLGASSAASDMALVRIAALRARAGDAAAAARLFEEAITLHHTSGMRTSVVAVVGQLVPAFQAIGRPEAGAVLAGALSVNYFGVAHTFTPGQLREQADAQQRIRGLIGSDRTEQALARGRDMTYDQTVEFALNELDEIIDQTDA